MMTMTTTELLADCQSLFASQSPALRGFFTVLHHYAELCTAGSRKAQSSYVHSDFAVGSEPLPRCVHAEP